IRVVAVQAMVFEKLLDPDLIRRHGRKSHYDQKGGGDRYAGPSTVLRFSNQQVHFSDALSIPS
ncbi:MAG TPA: hypothetical protein DCG12_12675, partial [Planctomycetaceae bacterium]|nr:hypothetical protein [Planctomycetaceae bacterium]